MTKSALMFKDLNLKEQQIAEQKRHNARQEGIAIAGNVISAVTGLASAASRPLSAAIAAKSGMKQLQFKDAASKQAAYEEYQQMLDLKNSGKRLPGPEFKRFLQLQKLFGGKK